MTLSGPGDSVRANRAPRAKPGLAGVSSMLRTCSHATGKGRSPLREAWGVGLHSIPERAMARRPVACNSLPFGFGAILEVTSCAGTVSSPPSSSWRSLTIWERFVAQPRPATTKRAAATTIANTSGPRNSKKLTAMPRTKSARRALLRYSFFRHPPAATDAGRKEGLTFGPGTGSAPPALRVLCSFILRTAHARGCSAPQGLPRNETGPTEQTAERAK